MDNDLTAHKNGHQLITADGGSAYDDGKRVGSVRFDYDAADREFMAEQREIGRREVQVNALAILRKVADRYAQDSNPVLAAECYLYACGMSELSEVEIAKKHGVVKAAVSKRVKLWQELLDLPPLGAMRTEKACKTFEGAQLKAWKKKKAKAHE